MKTLKQARTCLILREPNLMSPYFCSRIKTSTLRVLYDLNFFITFTKFLFSTKIFTEYKQCMNYSAATHIPTPPIFISGPHFFHTKVNFYKKVVTRILDYFALESRHSVWNWDVSSFCWSKYRTGIQIPGTAWPEY